MQEVIQNLNLMLEAIVEQETMLVVMLEAIVKLEVIQDVNSIKRYSKMNIFLLTLKILFIIKFIPHIIEFIFIL